MFLTVPTAQPAPARRQRTGCRRRRRATAPVATAVPIFPAGSLSLKQALYKIDKDLGIRNYGQKKGDWLHLPERPVGCFAQMVPVPFSRNPQAHLGNQRKAERRRTEVEGDIAADCSPAAPPSAFRPPP